MSLMKSRQNLTSTKRGTLVEEEVCEMFKTYGFQAFLQHKDIVGRQPVDIIALKGNVSILLDAKNIEKGYRFEFKRVEENQENCMHLALLYSQIERRGFAIKCQENNIIYFLPFDLYYENKSKVSSITDVRQLPKFVSMLTKRREEAEFNGEENYGTNYWERY